MLSLDVHADGRSASLRLRYERIPVAGKPMSLERNWERRWWSQAQFRDLLLDAQFAEMTFLDEAGSVAAPDAPVFVALARKD
jgi:hypothetical protein